MISKLFQGTGILLHCDLHGLAIARYSDVLYLTINNLLTKVVITTMMTINHINKTITTISLVG